MLNFFSIALLLICVSKSANLVGIGNLLSLLIKFNTISVEVSKSTLFPHDINIGFTSFLVLRVLPYT